MPVNSNIVKPINNPNRFGPQPGGGLLSRSSMTVNPAQQASRPGPINSPYPTASMTQRTVGGNPLLARTNGRLVPNVPSWNYTPGTPLPPQNLTSRQQPFSGYPSSLHNVHTQPNDILDMSEFPALGSANTTASNASTSGLSSTYATTAGTGAATSVPNDGRSLHHQTQTQEFSIDDFPALPGATSSNTNRGVVGSHSTVSHHLVNHQQQGTLDPLNNSSGLTSSTLQDGRLGLGGIRTTVQPPVNTIPEQDKKNYATKAGNSLHVQVQPSSAGSSLNPLWNAEPLRPSTPYSTTSTLVGVPPYSSIPSMQSSSGSTPSINSSPSNAAQGDPFGLMGLLNVIRMTDPDLSMLALGSDLATLGLNLNSPDSALYATFTSPWADNNQLAGLIEPEYHLPSCYNVQPPPPAQSKISSFSDETLFYIFYSMPRDILQEAAAQELYNRNWRYHRELKLWLTKEHGTEPFTKTAEFERGSYIFFDPENWEKTKKEALLMYQSLEDRPPMMSGMGGMNATAAGVSLTPGSLQQQQQQAVAQQNLSANAVNMAGLMGLGGIPTGGVGAGGLSAGALAGLGATPAQLQLHHQYSAASNAGQHHQLGPIPGLGQSGAHFIAQGGLKDF